MLYVTKPAMSAPNEAEGNVIEFEDDETGDFLVSKATGVTALPKNMATEDSKHSKHKKYKTSSSNIFFQHLTTTAHACTLLYVILIIYFCFSEQFQFFTWHPLLLSVGWMFLMTEAILTVSKDNLLTGTLPKSIRIRLHWIFQAIALTCITIGFVVVFVNKNYLNKTHFKTWHALLGFIGIVCAFPATLDGVGALYHSDLRQYIRPKINKFVHILSGTIAYAFGGAALILSVYTNWFSRHSNGNVLVFGLGLVFVTIAVGWTLVRPVMACTRQLKHLM